MNALVTVLPGKTVETEASERGKEAWDYVLQK